MQNFSLDSRLEADCHELGFFDSSILLLMRNALFPWFILVPRSMEIEFYKLDHELQLEVLGQINLVSRFIEDHFIVDKINIGSIGNVVSQLHVHIVGRRKTDACWPDVVWGVKKFEPYDSEQVEEIKEKLVVSSKGLFRIYGN